MLCILPHKKCSLQPPILPSESTPTLQSAPTLLLLMRFPNASCESNKMDIIAKIAAKGHYLGIHLLNDGDGAKTSVIENNFKGDLYRISLEIFTCWLQGQGRKPVTWATLVSVLKDIDLLILASEIETSLTQSV